MLKLPCVEPRGIRAASRAWERAVRRYARPGPGLRRERSALLVVDMQRFFLDPGGPAYLPSGAAVLPAVRRLVDAFRDAGRPVAYGVYVTAPGGPMARRWRRRCPPRSRWAGLAEGLEAGRGERLFVKSGYSALRGTGLGAWLRVRGVSDLVVAGVMTNLCVEATVRDAFDAGLNVFVPLDGCAAGAEELHVGSLRTMAQGFATVMRSGVILSKIGEQT
ncbi:MAG: isochorismatase family cysteine hydrolase [Elusimicrobiota bacterium]